MFLEGATCTNESWLADKEGKLQREYQSARILVDISLGDLFFVFCIITPPNAYCAFWYGTWYVDTRTP
jgi:hypothetical protein